MELLGIFIILGLGPVRASALQSTSSPAGHHGGHAHSGLHALRRSRTLIVSGNPSYRTIYRLPGTVSELGPFIKEGTYLL